MRELLLDAQRWNSADDVYDAFFVAVGAPSWHGRNFNALRDSIAVGQVNAVDVPYRVVIRNCDKAGAEARAVLRDFIELIRELNASGVDVDVSANPD